jgi:stress-induced morphogen
MRLLADYFPLILFFVAFKWQGIYFATGVAIAASLVQIAYLRWRRGRVAVINWLSLAIIVVFGGATLLLHDEVFIKWKPTVLYALFGAILAGGRLFFGRNLLAHLMTGISLPEASGRVSRGRGSHSSGSWRPRTGTSLSTIRPTRGSTSRCGAASACSSSSRSRRACCSRGTCARRHRDAAHRRRRRAGRPAQRLAALAPSELDIRDDSAPTRPRRRCRRRWALSILIVSEAFSGLPRLARHQRVLREFRPSSASDPRAVHQGADAGRVSFPTTKDDPPMTKQKLTIPCWPRCRVRRPSSPRARTSRRHPRRPPHRLPARTSTRRRISTF